MMSGPHSAAFSRLSRRASGMRIMVSNPDAGCHAAKISGLGKGDGCVLHLNPDNFEAHMGCDLQKDGIVEIECGAQNGLSVGLVDRLVQTVHTSSDADVGLILDQ